MNAALGGAMPASVTAGTTPESSSPAESDGSPSSATALGSVDTPDDSSPADPADTASRSTAAPETSSPPDLLPDPDASPFPPEDLEYGADLVGALITVIKQIGQMRGRLAPTGDYDISQTFLLIRLADQGPTRAGELAEKICADPSTVSRQVAALVRAGYIERRADPDDGRASLLVLTPSGREHIGWHRRMRGAVLAPLIARWSVAERDTFLRLLIDLTRGLDAHRDAIVATLMAHHPDRSN